ncbi:MAG: SIS domain-containing protein [Mycobacteriaceae bacterium]
MLNFDEERFVRIQSGAIAAGVGLRQTIGDLLEEGAENLFFLGAGGAGVLMTPAAQLLDRMSSFPARVAHAAEIVVMPWNSLGPKSIVVVPSRSGTTEESVTVLEFARKVGATSIALTGHEHSPVARLADHSVVNFVEDDTSSESFYVQALLIALAIMQYRGEFGDYDRVVAELHNLPQSLVEAKRAFEERAADIARQIKDLDFHVISGSGNTWPEAWYYGTCILEEMQWIKTRPIHASDFFHGTLELLVEDTSVLLFKGEDEARPLVGRVEAWAPTVSKRVIVLDTAECVLPGVSPDVRAMLSPVVLATWLERVNAHLEVLRNHPLTTRRYYRQLAY